jgi:hypothetical protein
MAAHERPRLIMKVMGTPDDWFADLPGYPFAPEISATSRR